METRRKLEPVTFHSTGDHAVRLEGVFHTWDGADHSPAAIVCHPHPLGGGTMYNDVVVTIAKALAEREVLALCFNFRGVGASEGRHDHGRGERFDLMGALEWLLTRSEVDHRRVSLVGYSFGAGIALACAAGDPRVRAVATVSVVAEACDAAALGTLIQPKLFVVGQDDQLTSPQHVQELVEELPPPKELQLVAGADHFWHGQVADLAGRVATFVASI